MFYAGHFEPELFLDGAIDSTMRVPASCLTRALPNVFEHGQRHKYEKHDPKTEARPPFLESARYVPAMQNGLTSGYQA